MKTWACKQRSRRKTTTNIQGEVGSSGRESRCKLIVYKLDPGGRAGGQPLSSETTTTHTPRSLCWVPSKVCKQSLNGEKRREENWWQQWETHQHSTARYLCCAKCAHDHLHKWEPPFQPSKKDESRKMVKMVKMMVMMMMMMLPPKTPWTWWSELTELRSWHAR